MATLQKRLARGEQAAFAELYDTFAPRVFRYLLVRVGRRSDAEDLLQETFCRVARSRDRLTAVVDLEAYLITTARHEIARVGALSWRIKQREPAEQLAGVAAPAADAELHELAEIADRALSLLSSEQREVVEMKVIAGLTLAQVAEVTSLPPGTVASRYRAALEKMQAWYGRFTS